MRRKKTGLLCLYLIFLSVFASTGEAQKASPIIGRWDLTVHGADAPYTSWLEVTDAEGKLQGRFVGRFGSARPIKQIEFNDGKLKFSLPPQYENMKVDLVFEGALIGGKLEGSTNGEDGAMLNSKGCVDIITEQKFRDFKLSLEFKLADPQVNGGRPSNSGVYLRGRYEAQIEDTYGKEPERHGMGGLYGFLTPKVNASKKAGEWQKYEITLIGRQLTVTLNDQTVIDKEEIPGITGGALDSAEEAPGPIMLQGDHGKVWFRNVVLTHAK